MNRCITAIGRVSYCDYLRVWFQAESCRLTKTRPRPRSAGGVFIFIFIYLQANEQDIKISIKQTQSQYSMPHGRRRVMTPLTRDRK